jgi:hypothetical protein
VDPLADQYRALLRKHGHAPNSLLVQGYGEELASIFSEDAFDMVWIHNALDHSQSPAGVMRAMTHVVRCGGYLVIQGWCREGTAEGWSGLHQYDLYLDSKRLMCKTRKGKPEPIDQHLPLAVAQIHEQNIERPWLRIIYRKLSTGARAALRHGRFVDLFVSVRHQVNIVEAYQAGTHLRSHRR